VVARRLARRLGLARPWLGLAGRLGLGSPMGLAWLGLARWLGRSWLGLGSRLGLLRVGSRLVGLAGRLGLATRLAPLVASTLCRTSANWTAVRHFA
jgi:hypothetical protein